MVIKKLIRFLIKSIVAILVLVIVLAVLFRIQLAGPLALRVAGHWTGLDITADRMAFDTDGQLTLSRLAVTIPHEPEPFFTAERLSVTMHSLADILTERTLNITDVQLIRPTLTVRIDAEGRLNIAQLLPERPDRPDRPPPAVPDVSIVAGTFTVEPHDKEPLSARPIDFRSRTTSDNRIQFALTLAEKNRISGVVDPQTLTHQLALRMDNLDALPIPLDLGVARALTIQAGWEGHITTEPWRIDGTLFLTSRLPDQADASLQAAIAIDADTLTADIHQLSAYPWPLLGKQDEPPEAIDVTQGTLRIDYADQRLDLDAVQIALLEGQILFDATVYPRQWQQSRAHLDVTGLRLGPVLGPKPFQDAILSGAVGFEPAKDPRPMEPMAISLRARLDGEKFRAAGLEEFIAEGYFSEKRLVTRHTEIPVFGGVLSPWLSFRRRDGEVFAHLISDFKDLNLQHIAGTFGQDGDQIAGTLSGTVRCRISTALQMLSGSADLSLANSDLMRTDIIGAVYSALDLRLVEPQPEGYGTLSLAAQGQKVEIMSFEYFNRGIEIRGAGTIDEVMRGMDSPVRGFVTGSARPLHQRRIPGAAELDRIFRGLQAGMVTIRVDGTLAEPAPRPVPMTEVEGAIRALLQRQLAD